MKKTNMENETKLALFIGGDADGKTKEIIGTESRLKWLNSVYLSLGTLETEKDGSVEIYALDGMKPEEINKRVERIKSKV